MKISPMAATAAHVPGQALNSVNVGRTATPERLERAMARARGEEAPQTPPEQVEQPRPNVRSLKMKTNYSTNRDIPAPEEVAPAAGSGFPPAEAAPAAQPENPAIETQSSATDNGEQGEVEATQPLSPQHAALAKQRRAFQLEKAEFEKQKAEILAKGEGMSTEDFRAKLQSDPLGVLQEYGVTYDALTEAILSDKQQINPEIQALKAEIKALKEGVDKTFQTNEQRQEEAALTEMLYEAEALAKEGEDFEMIRAEDAYDQVLRLIHATYKETGRVLDVREAMNKVETTLLAKAEKLASINKVRNKIAPPSPPAAQPAPRPQGMRTLTARDTAAPTLDRRARAIAAMQGTLKR